MTPPRVNVLKFIPGRTMMKNLALLAATGGLITLAGMIFAPERIWPNILLAGYYVLGLSLGAGVFIALQYVSNAGWSVAIRRVPEAIASAFGLGAGILVVSLAGLTVTYEWTHAEVVAADPILSGKAAWLNIPFFVARMAVYLAVWGWLLGRMLSTSRRQDADGDVGLTGVNKRHSVVYLVAFAFTFTLASMDWIMSIEPHWYSTIFGIYNFSGIFVAALSAITIISIVLRRTGQFRDILNDRHLLNLGKLMFAFSTFWMYIWFSQYLLIWYANIPEEVVYMLRRQEGSWVVFTIVNVLFNWLIPFVVLLPRWTKRNEGLLLKICILLLLGHWIDLFWMILPPFMPAAPVVNVWEIGPLLFALPLFFLIVFRTLSRHPVVPLRDPMLVESLEQH